MTRTHICIFSLYLLVLRLATVVALDNGLARTPPMGWMSWERFRCNTDCTTYPEQCISERLFREMADLLLVGGYRDAGYEYVIIDDCWLAHERDKNGKLAPDGSRFPSGIPALSSYIHKLGLKFGIYEDYGNFTCGGYPGILGHMKTDAQTFADWNVDYVKLDGCYSDPNTMIVGYPLFGRYLNETGRPIVYSCSWPAYQIGDNPNYAAIAEHCNLWRNFDDIDDSWTSLLSIIDFYGDDKDKFGSFAGPGKWNDPDMLIIGNFGLSLDQAKVQMGMWCLFAAPLIMSNDLRNIRPEFREILLNREAIKIDQDPLGIQAKRIIRSGNIDIFSRPVMPSYKKEYSAAVGFLNRYTSGTPLRVRVKLTALGLHHTAGYAAKDVFSGKLYGKFHPDDTFVADVNPTGFLFVRFNVLPGDGNSYLASEGRESNEVHQSSADTPLVEVEAQGLTGWRSEL